MEMVDCSERCGNTIKGCSFSWVGEVNRSGLEVRRSAGGKYLDGPRLDSASNDLLVLSSKCAVCEYCPVTLPQNS